jgi:steroid Delta-isomerase
VPVGPFRGRAAIAEAYRTRPPDDEIDILSASESSDSVEAEYAWRRDHGKRAGRMVLDTQDGRIRRLLVTFE